MSSTPLQNRIRFSQLRLLVHVAETGSLQAASQRLHVSQPAVTKTLQQLELAVGSPVVQRGSTGSVLTPIGQLLCRRARFILSEVRDMEAELGLFNAGGAGQVVIGCLPVAAPVLLPLTLTRLMHEFPRITVRVVEGTSDALFPRLKEGHVDLVVGRFWPRDEPDFVNEILFDSKFALAARAEHPLVSQRALAMDEATSWPWILPPPGAHSRSALEAMFLEAGAKPPPHPVETSSYQVIRSLLRSTDMVCPLPVEILKDDVSLGILKLLPLKLEVRLPPVGVVRLAHRVPSPAVDTFVDCLRDASRRGLEVDAAAKAPARRAPSTRSKTSKRR